MRRYDWDKKLVIKMIVFTVLFFLMLQTANRIKLAYGNEFDLNDNMRWLWQACNFLAIVSAAYVITHLPKLLPKQLKKDIFNTAAWIFKKIGDEVHKAYYAVRHALGIPDPPKRTKKRDERSFVFDMEDNDLVRRFRNLGGGLKWKDLENNADKIRFIYIKYINKLMKKGYKFSTILTPMETLTKWKLEEHESAYMFPLYTDARYSGGRRPILDAEVERCSKYMKTGSKIED